MTDAPPPAEAPETPAVKARKKRTRLQALAFFGGMGAAILAALLLVTAIGGRMYLLSDSGRGDEQQDRQDRRAETAEEGQGLQARPLLPRLDGRCFRRFRRRRRVAQNACPMLT